MLDWILRKIAAKWWQRRTRKAALASADPAWVAEWKSMFPGRCMYCSYTRWANEEQGQSLKLEPHRCIEGHSPPEYMPPARVVRQ